MTSYHYLTHDALVAERRHTYVGDGDAARLAKQARMTRQKTDPSAARSSRLRRILKLAAVRP